MILKLNYIKEKVYTLNIPNKKTKFKKTDFLDAFLLILYCDINRSQENVVSEINSYKPDEDKIHCTSFIRRENKISVDFYEELLKGYNRFGE